MFKHNAIALAVSTLSVLAGCSTVSAPERAATPQRAAIAERAGTVQPVMTVRNSSGVDSEGMYRIGRYFQGQMRHEDAVGAYRKALALDPFNVEARNALGVVYSIQGLAADAEQAFKAAIAMAPGLSHLHGNLGYHYLQAGRTEEARTALRESIRLDPANQRALTSLAATGADVAAPVANAPAPPVEAAAPTVLAAVAPVMTASLSTAAAAASLPAPEARPLATIADLIGTRPATPNAQLVALAPNVWQLRPQAAQAAALPASIPRSVILQTDKAVSPSELPAIVRLEISNGNGIAGLARRVGGYLRSLGMNSPRLTNQRPFDQRHTQIQYVRSMGDSARDLKAALGTPADLVMTPTIDRNAQIRVVLGKDFYEIEAVARMRGGTIKQVALVSAPTPR